MRCCRCGREMLLVEYTEIEIDYCPDCGIWLDSGELELILGEDSLRKNNRRSSSDRGSDESRPNDKPIKCPVCRAKMAKDPYDELAKTIVDICPRGHGVWLDRGELNEIVETHLKADSKNRSAVTAFLAGIFRENPKEAV